MKLWERKLLGIRFQWWWLVAIAGLAVWTAYDTVTYNSSGGAVYSGGGQRYSTQGGDDAP